MPRMGCPTLALHFDRTVSEQAWISIAPVPCRMADFLWGGTQESGVWHHGVWGQVVCVEYWHVRRFKIASGRRRAKPNPALASVPSCLACPTLACCGCIRLQGHCARHSVHSALSLVSGSVVVYHVSSWCACMCMPGHRAWVDFCVAQARHHRIANRRAECVRTHSHRDPRPHLAKLRRSYENATLIIAMAWLGAKELPNFSKNAVRVSISGLRPGCWLAACCRLGARWRSDRAHICAAGAAATPGVASPPRDRAGAAGALHVPLLRRAAAKPAGLRALPVPAAIAACPGYAGAIAQRGFRRRPLAAEPEYRAAARRFGWAPVWPVRSPTGLPTPPMSVPAAAG